MSATEENTQHFPREVYQKTYIELKSLSERLPEESVVSLAREVINRLAVQAVPAASVRSTATREAIFNLARALLSSDTEASADIVKGLRDDGVSVDDLYLVYLSNAAIMLGEWWDNDEVTSVDVTIGAGRIYALMRALNTHGYNVPEPIGRSAMFASVPDETHTLGVKMAADLFRKRGWEIDLKFGLSHDELAVAIADARPKLVGLSAGGAHAAAALAKLIVAIRLSSPSAAIMVSGQIVNEAPDVVALLDPEAVADGYNEAVEAMDRLWEQRHPKKK